jgi:hypothetical protein
VTRRLLVLSFHAPPELAVGGLRWAGLSRHLAERGWEVRVITAAPGAAGIVLPGGVEVREVPRRITVQDRYRSWRQRTAAERSTPDAPPRGGSGGAGGSGEPVMVRVIRTIRMNLYYPLFSFPDHGRGWVLRAARETRRSVREWAPDAAVSTGPPHSAHLAAALGLAGTAIPWIVDLRDPWATPAHSLSETGWRLAAARRLEAMVFRRAGRVVTTTRELGEAIRQAHPATAPAWLPNGVDVRELPRRTGEGSPGLSITHLGAVYFNRDPAPVIHAFARFLKENPDGAPGSVLRFVGFVSPDFRHTFDQAVDDLGIRRHVEVVDAVPRDRALEMLAGSDMALVLAQGQHMMIPAKLYEAVGMGLPTLVVTERDSSTGREAERIGAAAHEPGDEAGMAATMAAAWRDGGARGSVRAGGAPALVDHAHLAGELEALLRALSGPPERSAVPTPGPAPGRTA